MFIVLIAAFEYNKIGERVFELLNSFVEEIGDANVTQIISYSASNYSVTIKF